MTADPRAAKLLQGLHRPDRQWCAAARPRTFPASFSRLFLPFPIEAITAAAAGIAPVFRHSPQFRAESLGAVLGCDLTVKVETVNPIRSFKGRGTDWFVQGLTEARPLVCASAGNFGQGLAYAARARAIPLTVFASLHANPLKVERMCALGATVRQAGEDFDAAKAAAQEFARSEGQRYVEDGREAPIAIGAGTIAVELLASGDRYDAIVIPLGNGALLGGMATWIKSVAPGTEVIGVCAAAAPSMKLSWERGAAIETTSAATIADGIAVRVPIVEAVDSLRGIVDDIVLVDERQIIESMRVTWRETGLVVEPAGVVGVTAIAADRSRFAGRRVATVLCGGNVTPQQAVEWRLTDPG
ncbi:MAG: pyridoxal-phosphate dependent enzyme [Gemmatimonadetes bacterium]|nr:pyridoxal-phosphate dependent enzyme [Gemmatimonadota bacterium]